MAIKKEDRETCDFCGQVLPDEEENWLFIELLRGDPKMESICASFCSQEHAAEWFRKPLPEAEAFEPYKPTIRERIADLALIGLLALAVVLSAIGSWTVVQWLWH